MSELKQQYQTEKKNKAKLEEDLFKLRQNYESAVAKVSDGGKYQKISIKLGSVTITYNVQGFPQKILLKL